MKVKQLMEQLAKLDGELEILCFTEDDGLVAPGYDYRLLDIEDVDFVEAERRWGGEGIPTLKFGKSDTSETIVTLNVTGTF
jgi:hypothetical protein